MMVLALGGCGDTDEPRPRAAASSTVESSDVVQFRALANDVCATVSQGAPASLAPTAGPADLKRYARASVRVSKAMAVSLPRLPVPASLRPAVTDLARAYRDAHREYAAIARADVTPSGAGALMATLRERESAILARAAAAGLPECAGALGR